MSAFSVFAPGRFMRLFASDAISISRDPMMMFAAVLSVVPAVALWLTAGAIDDAAFAAFGIPQFSRYVVPFALTLPPFIIGWVTGFLLLEDRDEGTLLAIDVTPTGKAGFLAYRVAVTAVVTLAITVLGISLLTHELDPVSAGAILVLVPIEAMIGAVVIPAVARNKVEGLALTKLTNIAAMVPLLAIIPSPWRYLGGIVPTYWIGEILMLSDRQYLAMPVVLALAVASHAIVAIVLFRLFVRRAG